MFEEIKEFIKDIKMKYPGRIKKAILFGSYARGDAGPESDIDILIVWDGNRKEGIEEIEDIAFDYLLNQELYFSIKVLDMEHYDKMKKKGNPFLKNVELEGVSLV